MDLTPDLTLPDAFEIVDKEMSEKKYDSLTYTYKSLTPCAPAHSHAAILSKCIFINLMTGLTLIYK